MAFDINTAKPEKQKSKGFDISTAKPAQVGGAEAVQKGFIRGVEQSLGGAAQKAVDARYNQINEKITKFIEMQESGEIPFAKDKYPGITFNQNELIDFSSKKVRENPMAALEALQNEASRLAKMQSDYEAGESNRRKEYAPIQEARPILSTAGNIGGQMAAIPIPGAQARLPFQMLRGAAEGAAFSAIQPTVGDESNKDDVISSSMIGAAAPAVLRPITNSIGGAYRAITGKASGESADVARYADENNLPLMTSDVTPPDTFVGGSARSLGEKIPLTGTGAVRAEQQTARINEIKKLSDQYGIPSDAEIVASLNRKADKLSAAAGNRYSRTIEAMADTPIPLNNTIKAIDYHIDQYTRPGSAQNPQVIEALRKFKDQISSGDNNLELLRQNRTLFRELIKGEDDVMSDSAKRINDSVYKALTQDMQAGVAKKLGTDTANALKQVDGIWARESQQLKNTKLKNIFAKGDIKPEEATKMLFSNDKTEAKTLYDALDKKGRDNARAAIINRAVERSNESPERFISEMKKLQNQSDVFFRGNEKKQLLGMINYLNYTRQAGKAALVTPTGQQAIQIGAPVGVMTDFATTGGLGTLAFGTIGAASRVYESAPVRTIMMRMASIPPNSTQFEKAAKALEIELQKAATRAPQAREEK